MWLLSTIVACQSSEISLEISEEIELQLETQGIHEGSITAIDPLADTAAPDLDCPLGLEIGTGRDEYIPLAPYAPLVLGHHPSGDWVLYISGLYSGLEDLVEVSASLHRSSDGEQLSSRQSVRYVQGIHFGECVWRFSGLWLYLDVEDLAEVCALEGELLELRLAVTDLYGAGQVDASVLVAGEPAPQDLCP